MRQPLQLIPMETNSSGKGECLPQINRGSDGRVENARVLMKESRDLVDNSFTPLFSIKSKELSVEVL